MVPLKLRNARALITGGAGLIGSHIADRLVRESVAEIVVLDNFARGRREHLAEAASAGRVTIVDGDIRNRVLMAEVMQGIDVVFHQAALCIKQCAEDPALAVDVLINGTCAVVDAARKAQVRKVIAASSAAVYGLADRFPTCEDHHPYNNRTLYGSAKTFNEGLLRAVYEQHGLDYVALRYFSVYGPRMDVRGAYTDVFIRWMESVAANKPLTIFGDGSSTLDLIYVDDIARANILAACAPVTDRTYNIGTGTEISLTEVAELLLRTMGSTLSIEYAPTREGHQVPRRLADTWRAQHEFGFQANVPFERGLKKLVDWWQHAQLKTEVPA